MVLTSIFGSGNLLYAQIFVIITSIATSLFILFILKKFKKMSLIKPVIIPLILFFIFGTLDVLATLHGTWLASSNEGNPIPRFFFEKIGWKSIYLLTFVWGSIVTLITVLSGVLEKRWRKRASIIRFIRLVFIYVVAIGHFIGFNSWVIWFVGIQRIDQFIMLSLYSIMRTLIILLLPTMVILLACILTRIIFGIPLAILHMIVSRTTSKKSSKKC